MKKVNRYKKTSSAIDMFPYFVFRNENISMTLAYRSEILEIKEYYNAYNNGSDFVTEGSAGYYLPSSINYKINSNLIRKQSRFMFSHMPDINISGSERDEQQIEEYKKVINKVLEKNDFGQKLLEASKDCFIGKRVACLISMSERAGIIIRFYSSLEFYCEHDPVTREITKFLSFENISNVKNRSERLYIVNRYEIVNNVVYVSSVLYNGHGEKIETYVENHATDLKEIPVVVIINGDLVENKNGISDLAEAMEYESGYSRIANAEIDTDRKGMNPIKYTIDMNPNTTKNLPSGPGAYWDLQHDSNIDNPNPSVGSIAPNMQHTEPIRSVLDRLRSMMYESMDIPDISKDGLLSGITSFKALKALYYPLSNRADEKLVAWKPAIKKIIKFSIELAALNEEITKVLYMVSDMKMVPFDIEVVENYAIIDDENEEKQIDLEEIATKTRSRFSYLKKWRGSELKTDDDVEEELMRIAEEENMFDALGANPVIQRKTEEKEEEQKIEDEIEETKIETI